MTKRGALSDISPSSACVCALAHALSLARAAHTLNVFPAANRARTDAGPAKRRAAAAPAPAPTGGGVFESAMEEAGVRLALVPKEDDSVCAVRWQCTSLGDAAAERSVARLLEAVRGQLRRKFVKSEAAAEGARGPLSTAAAAFLCPARGLSSRARSSPSPGASQRS